ncbi:MAG: hypothetical protein NT027_20310, partial [Proteobacteria bacterium]|nr:hypothetical protein [Pseudomonadota bacterium]
SVILFSYHVNANERNEDENVQNLDARRKSSPIFDCRYVTLFSDYKKPAIVLQPAGNGSPLSVFGSQHKAFIFQPNTGPSLGVGVGFQDDVDISLSLPVRQWVGRKDNRGESKGLHAQFHLNQSRTAIDVTYTNMSGFFIDEAYVGRVEVVDDVLIHGDSRTYLQRPEMSLQNISISGRYLLFENSHVNLNMIGGTESSNFFRWSPVIGFDASKVLLVDQELFFPSDSIKKDTSNSFPNDDQAKIKGVDHRSASVHGGFVIELVYLGTRLLISTVWGPAVSYVDFQGLDAAGKVRLGNSGAFSGQLSRSISDDYHLGVRGYKSERSVTSSDMTLSESTSLAEIFVSRVF